MSTNADGAAGGGTSGIPDTDTDVIPSEFEGDIMQITVNYKGTSKTYQAHKTLLSRSSPYFSAMTNFKEGDENQLIIEGVRHNVFRHILSWVYRRDLDSQISQISTTLMYTWAAADRFLMHDCKNTVLDKLQRYHMGDAVTVDDLRVAAEIGGHRQHLLVRYVVDQLALDILNCGFYKRHDLVDMNFDGVPKDLVVAVLGAVHENVMRTDDYVEFDGTENPDHPRFDEPAKRKGCYYHEHVAGESCSRQEEDESS